METRRGKATVRALEAAHYSHDYLNEALVIRGEAIVSSRRQDPRRWDRPVNQEAGRTHQSAGPNGRRRSRRAQTLMSGTRTQPDYHCTPGG